MNVWIYAGIPGSGKSTIIKNVHPKSAVFSTDDYYKKNGEYNFKAELLSEAHAWNLRRFVEHIQKMEWDVDTVVDNTNTTIAEMAPYVAVAKAYGHKVKVVLVTCNPQKAWERNVHGVPLATVEKLHEQFVNLQIPPWWDHAVVVSEAL